MPGLTPCKGSGPQIIGFASGPGSPAGSVRRKVAILRRDDHNRCIGGHVLTRRGVVTGIAAAGLAGCAEMEAVPASERAQVLIAAVREQMKQFVFYDGGYVELAYPGGDPPSNRGACTDVLIRGYRALSLDLQQLVHEDMLANFSSYPQSWGLKVPDSNIDHRRVPNLALFFERSGKTLPVSGRAEDYQPGDIITVRPQHIALVSDRRVRGRDNQIVVLQNNGFGVREDVQDIPSDVTGHFRYEL